MFKETNLSKFAEKECLREPQAAEKHKRKCNRQIMTQICKESDMQLQKYGQSKKGLTLTFDIMIIPES